MAAWGLDTSDTRHTVVVVRSKGTRCEWLRDAGLALALVLAAAALSLALLAKGCDCCCATPPGSEPYATHAEVAALNHTLAPATAEVVSRLASVEVGAAVLCAALYESKALATSLEAVQEVNTSGAVDWEAFKLDGATYLAVANYNDDSTYNIKSRIYRHSALSGKFELLQEVDTSGAFDWEVFTLDDATYLALANYRNDSTFNLKSCIYRHSAVSGRFELLQEVGTSGARDWKAFTIDGATYLAVANYYDGITFILKSRIYRHSVQSGFFELVQEVDTSGARDWEAFTLGGATYLAVANFYNGKSRIYRYSAISSRFEMVQEVDTSGAHDWKAFTLDGATYLALANHYDNSTYNVKSRIYRHSAMSGRFELVQEVDTIGAFHWEAFTLDGATYLAVANHLDAGTRKLKSRIYRHSAQSGLFELVQEVDTSSAADWEAFTLEGTTYLAVANAYDGITHNLKSRIYRFVAPC